MIHCFHQCLILADMSLPLPLSRWKSRRQSPRLAVGPAGHDAAHTTDDCRVLADSGRLSDFKRNPQQFIDLVAEAIKRVKRSAIVDGVKHQNIGGDCFYAQKLFEQEVLLGYLRSSIAVEKSVHERVVYESGTEADFARQLELNESIRVYAKLPRWFKVPTPLGESYNPDWAVLVEQDGSERLYLVVETKSSLFSDDLRDKENSKIACGKAHFEALAVSDRSVQYKLATSVGDLFA